MGMREREFLGKKRRFLKSPVDFRKRLLCCIARKPLGDQESFKSLLILNNILKVQVPAACVLPGNICITQ